MPHKNLWQPFRNFSRLALFLMATLALSFRPCFAQYTSAVEVASDSVIVEVKIDNGQTAHLLLDTGAQITTFSKAGAARLQLKTVPPPHPSSVFSGLGTLARLSIGGLTMERVAFGVLETRKDVWDQIPSQDRVDGSLGLDVLSRYAIGLDLVGHTIVFWPEGHVTAQQRQQWFDYRPVALPVSAAGAAANLKALAPSLPPDTLTHITAPDHLDVWLPLGMGLVAGDHTYKNPLVKALTPITLPLVHTEGKLFRVRGQLDTVPIQFEFDTGTNCMTAPQSFLTVLKPLQTMQGQKLHAIDAMETVRGCIFRRCSLGDFEMDFPYVLISTGQSAYTRTPTLGMNLFTDCKILMDFPAGTLSVARLLPGKDSPQMMLGRLGVFLIREGDKEQFIVANGSPADRAGLRNGDRLIRYEGLPPNQVDGSVSITLTNPDQPITLVARRAGVAQPLSFTFEREADQRWMAAPLVAKFPALPPGYSAAKRFPNGGVYQDAEGQTIVVKEGGNVAVLDGRYLVTYHDVSKAPVPVQLPSATFRIVGSTREPGEPPAVGRGEGLMWLGGIGWVIGPTTVRIQLDGFGVTLSPPPSTAIRAQPTQQP